MQVDGQINHGQIPKGKAERVVSPNEAGVKAMDLAFLRQEALCKRLTLS